MKKSTKSLTISVLFMLVIVSLLCFQFAIPAKAKTENTNVNQTFDKLPLGLAPAVAKALQENLPESYQVKKSGKTYQADNESHGMRYSFASNGPIVQDPDSSWKLEMALQRWGYEGDLQPVPKADLVSSEGRVEYKRGQILTEWYKNTAFGLEQGFTLSSRPFKPNVKDSHLTLEIAISGTLTPKLEDKTILLQNKKGETLSRYTGLYAYDNKHQTLPSRLVLADNTLSILVDDSKATYPIIIDPWVQKAKLTASDGNNEYFGTSVAVDDDTVVVGANRDYTPSYSTGSVYVFEKPENGWSTTSSYATKLLASDGEAVDEFGKSVDIYYHDIVVGAYGHDTGAGETDAGAIYVFEKPGSSWADAGATMTETIKFTAPASDRNEGDGFGRSVALGSGIIVVGAYHDDDDTTSPCTNCNWGAAYVFERDSHSTWPATGAFRTKLVASDRYVDAYWSDEFGISADVNLSGSTIIIGAHKEGPANSTGAAYIFTEPGGGWSAGETTTETAKLTASDRTASDYFGASVATNGIVAVVGAWGDAFWCDGSEKGDLGSAYVFEKPGTGWTDMTQTAKLTSGSCTEHQYVGRSVGISGDTIVAGADGVNESTYIYNKPDSGWANMTYSYKVAARDGTDTDNFGTSLAIDGEAIFVGAKNNINGRGAVYVFEPGSPAMPWMIPLLLN